MDEHKVRGQVTNVEREEREERERRRRNGLGLLFLPFFHVHF